MTDQGKGSGVWIGPTKCDEERLSRQNDLDNVWGIVKPMLEGDNFKPSVYGIVSLSLDLLREALNCYQNGAYLAVCSMCRACVEALLYLATKLKPTGDYDVIEVKENYVREKRKKFLKNALKSGLLDGEDKMIVEKIWEVGDFAMHIHQKLDRSANDFVKRVSEGHEVDGDRLKGWSDKDEASNTIIETAKLVSKIMSKLNASIQPASRRIGYRKRMGRQSKVNN